MSDFGHSLPESAEKFAAQHGIDIEADHRQNKYWITDKVLLAHLNASGDTTKQVAESGADYLFSQLDYFRAGSLKASRMVAKVLAGNRTELAYWTPAAPTKQLTVHRGEGSLVIARPGGQSTMVFRLDPEVTPTVVLAPDRFYAFEAAPLTPEPLVVSGLYNTETGVDWEKMEIALEPGQSHVTAPEGIIDVPEDFRDFYAGQ